jgi:hypothetical protein
MARLFTIRAYSLSAGFARPPNTKLGHIDTREQTLATKSRQSISGNNGDVEVGKVEILKHLIGVLIAVRHARSKRLTGTKDGRMIWRENYEGKCAVIQRMDSKQHDMIAENTERTIT